MSLAGIGKYQALSLSKTEPNHLLSAVRLFSIISILKRLLYLKFCCLPYRNRSYQRFPSAANSISRSSSNISNNISSVASLIFSALTSSRGLNSERSRTANTNQSFRFHQHHICHTINNIVGIQNCTYCFPIGYTQP